MTRAHVKVYDIPIRRLDDLIEARCILIMGLDEPMPPRGTPRAIWSFDIACRLENLLGRPVNLNRTVYRKP